MSILKRHRQGRNLGLGKGNAESFTQPLRSLVEREQPLHRESGGGALKKGSEVMPFDIYGHDLAHGHCEVHPSVPEAYPCSECMAEADYEKEAHEKALREMQEREINEWYERCEREERLSRET